MFKKFDKKLYEENDHKGKIFASSILKKMYPSYNVIEGYIFLNILEANIFPL